MHRMPPGSENERTLRKATADERDQSTRPQRRAASEGQGRHLTFERLYREVIRHASDQIAQKETICRSVGHLWSHCQGCPEDMEGLGDLFDALQDSDPPSDLRRLATILDQHLRPIICQRFRSEERAVLTQALKTLVMLRTLGLPYRSGRSAFSPQTNELLARLHRICTGDGLMAWYEEGAKPVYIVEREIEQFADWVLERQVALLGRQERDKALSDAVWAALFAENRPTTEGSFLFLPAPFAEREAVLVKHRTLGKRVIVFESPWQEEQGLRFRRVIRQLPRQVPIDHLWVWLPPPLGDELRQVTCYMALARALREADERNREVKAAVSVMGEAYLQASASALRAIIDSYQQGMIVTEHGTWKPNGEARSLASELRRLIVGTARKGRRGGTCPEWNFIFDKGERVI